MIFALLATLFIGYALGALFLLKGWASIPEYFYRNAPEKQSFISVIVPIRNEEANVGLLLEDLCRQSYRNFEVLVIDDHSTDGSAEVVHSFMGRPDAPSIHLLPLARGKETLSHKKSAISLGISQAQGDLIATTDGDCRVGPHWLRDVHAFYQQEKPRLISAGVTFFAEAPLFERVQTVEFMSLIGAGAASMHLGAPNMCNGANLIYEKTSFHEVGGFEGAWHIASGDDEFLMHKIHAHAPKGGVRFLKSPEAIVRTAAQPTFWSFFQQRKRWASKWNHYNNPKAVALAVGVYGFHLLVAGMMLCIPFWPETILPLLGIKCMGEIPYLYALMRYHGHSKPLLPILIAEIFHSPYIVVIGAAGQLGGYWWKGRKVR